MENQTHVESPADQPTYRLLIVEDDDIDSRHLERLLQSSSLSLHEVHIARSLKEAQDILRTSDIDCAVVDLNLPDSRGCDTVHAIQSTCADLAVVVVTGQESERAGIQALAEGAQDYLVKDDFNGVVLARAIRFACERKRIQVACRRSEERDKARQEEIRRQRDFAESLIETAQAIVLVLDTQGRVIRYNPYLEELSGYPLEDKVGLDWFEYFLPSEHRQEARESFECTIRYSRIGGMVHPICTAEGGIRHIEWYGRSLKDDQNEVIGILLLGQDITDKKQALDALQKSQDRLRAVWESILTGVALIDPATHCIVDVNPMAEEILGMSRAQLIGRTCRDFICGNTPGHCPVTDLGKSSHRSERVIRRADGRRISVLKSITKTTLHGQDYLIDSFIDITDRKEAEKAICAANDKLEQACRELKEMHSQVVQSEKLASIGQLAAGVAHEMNTPVGFVASNFETLQNYVGKMKDLLARYEELSAALMAGQDRELQTRLQQIQTLRQQNKMDFILEDIQGLFEESKEGLERVTTIVQNLRDFSRVDQAEAFDSYNINDGITATLVVARNTIKYDADVELHLGQIPPIPCCAGQVNQVLLNILVNAAQAIKGQQREDRGMISIATDCDEEKVTCWIKDDGPGIPALTLQKIFDPFFTTKPAGKGTGLGLSVSYDIVVNKHHGQLTVSSEEGRGTEFVMSLPLRQPEEGSPASHYPFCHSSEPDDSSVVAREGQHG